MTVNLKTNTIYVSSEIRNQFFVINGSTDSVEPSSKFMQQNSTGTIFNGSHISMAFNPNNGIIYAANVYLNSIYITDHGHFPSSIGKVNIGGLPSDIAVDTNTNFSYVVNKDHNTITVIHP